MMALDPSESRSVRRCVLIMTALLTGPSALAQVIAGPFVSPVNHHPYSLLGESTWEEAEALAVSLGGHLATVRTEEEQSWLFDRFGNRGGRSRSLWIGLHRISPGGDFAWIGGEPVTYTHWLPGQPDDSPVTQGENHVHMLNTANAYGHPAGYWNDLASPNWAFVTFNPLCGVVEFLSPVGTDVRLSLVSDGGGWRVEAKVPVTTVRLIWEVSPALDPPSWSVVDVQSDPSGRAIWSRTVSFEESAAFHRVRVQDTPGFNGRPDQTVQSVPESHPGALPLGSAPKVSTPVTALPESAVLRTVSRVNGEATNAEQPDPSGVPSKSSIPGL